MHATTGNPPNFDMLALLVDPAEGVAGFTPHRDRQPADVPGSFRSDGSPKYSTVWLALRDATPENSCLYFIPRSADPGFVVSLSISVSLSLPGLLGSCTHAHSHTHTHTHTLTHTHAHTHTHTHTLSHTHTKTHTHTHTHTHSHTLSLTHTHTHTHARTHARAHTHTHTNFTPRSYSSSRSFSPSYFTHHQQKCIWHSDFDLDGVGVIAFSLHFH
jgi:hypothetical protein